MSKQIQKINPRKLYKAELEHLIKESCGTSLLEIDQETVFSGINPDLDEISLMNKADFYNESENLKN